MPKNPSIQEKSILWLYGRGSTKIQPSLGLLGVALRWNSFINSITAGLILATPLRELFPRPTIIVRLGSLLFINLVSRSLAISSASLTLRPCRSISFGGLDALCALVIFDWLSNQEINEYWFAVHALLAAVNAFLLPLNIKSLAITLHRSISRPYSLAFSDSSKYTSN